MNIHVSSILIVLGFEAFMAAPARAQQSCEQGASSEETRERAADAFDEGRERFDQNDFQGAIEQFECSYQLVPHQATLFNLGESAEAAGDVELALSSFQEYLEQYPDADGREDVRQRVRALETLVGRTSTPPDEGGVTEQVETGEEAQPPVETRMTASRRAAWATLASGIALGITGGALIGVAVSRNDEYLQNRDDFEQGTDVGWDEDEFDSQAETGEGLEAGGWALLGIGLTSLAASAILFLIFDGEEPVGTATSQTFVSPIADRNGLLGLSLAGKF